MDRERCSLEHCKGLTIQAENACCNCQAIIESSKVAFLVLKAVTRLALHTLPALFEKTCKPIGFTNPDDSHLCLQGLILTCEHMCFCILPWSVAGSWAELAQVQALL